MLLAIFDPMLLCTYLMFQEKYHILMLYLNLGFLFLPILALARRPYM
nr:MAG TPA: hypothetical protein [Bacteriophage sp.]